MPDIAVNNPLVTVVTVTYNSAAYVRDAIESVLAQTYTHIEYIIGDDCSADNTWEIISGYRDKRIKAYRNEKNLGEYPNRNKAIAMASGKYLLFIDGDDYLYPYALDFYLKYAEANQNCAIVIQKGYHRDIIFPIMLQPREAFEDCYYGENLLASGFASNFFRTEILASVGKMSEQYVSGDAEIRTRIAFQYPTLYIFGNLAFSRETPNQASSKLTNGLGLLESLAYTHNLPSIPLNGISIESVEEVTKQIQYQIIRMAVKKALYFKFGQANYLLRSSNIYIKLFFKLLRTGKITRKWNYSPVNPKRDNAVINPFSFKE